MDEIKNGNPLRLLRRTELYGKTNNNEAEEFNDSIELRDEYYHYKVTKVKIWTNINGNIITGIQFFYKDIANLLPGSQRRHVEMKAHKKEKDANEEIENEIILKENQFLSNFCVKVNEYITSIGFALNTGESFIYGGESGEDRIIDLSDEHACIFAVYGSFSNYLESCGVYYVDRFEYIYNYLGGFFELRYIIRTRTEDEWKKDPETCTKNKLLAEKINSMKNINEPMRIIRKLCATNTLYFISVLRFLTPKS